MDDRLHEFGDVPGYEFDAPRAAGQPRPVAGGGERARQPCRRRRPRAGPGRNRRCNRGRSSGRNRGRSSRGNRGRSSAQEPWQQWQAAVAAAAAGAAAAAVAGAVAGAAAGTAAAAARGGPAGRARAAGRAGAGTPWPRCGPATGSPAWRRRWWPRSRSGWPRRRARGEQRRQRRRPVRAGGRIPARPVGGGRFRRRQRASGRGVRDRGGRPTEVAVGSANRGGALWVSADGGSTWRRAALTPAAAGRRANGQLAGVAHGPSGWLAVGGASAGPACPRPGRDRLSRRPDLDGRRQPGRVRRRRAGPSPPPSRRARAGT